MRGSARACEAAIFIIVGDGSMARIEEACVTGDRFEVALVLVLGLRSEWGGIVRASDSAKIPPPQPMSRYRRPGGVTVVVFVFVFVFVFASPSLFEEEDADRGLDSAMQAAINSWRSGFMRCRMREGPSGSHQLLAREEKWVISSEDTEEEDEWCRTLSNRMVLLLGVWRRRRVMFRIADAEVRKGLRVIVRDSTKTAFYAEVNRESSWEPN